MKNGKMRLNYDVLEARSGICGDFAALFQDMVTAAGIKNVETVSGYVLENQKSLKKHYQQKDMPEIGHAWNKVTLGKRSFFVDTTFMAKEKIGQEYENRNFVPKFKHKIELKNRARRNEVNQNITEFFIDFTPQKEIKEYKMLHLRDKYIK
ncbi:MAG: transglutaminase domain-containing protein [Alphaproteobacteria bacterium]|nr:transglutaminase domain-containing protein [Alphaproteobacteria bacterium]